MKVILSIGRCMSPPNRCPLAFMVALVLTALPVSLCAREDSPRVKIHAEHVSGNVHMLTGRGGNIGVSVGVDGVLIVDNQFANLTKRIQKAIKKLGGKKPRLVLNTHYHGDHIGGNAYFGVNGIIVAHENVYQRLLRPVAPLPGAGATAPPPPPSPKALPVVTFADRLYIHFNGDNVHVIHLPGAHTDGDSIVWFEADNVVHMGDMLFNGTFPYIDLDAGGSVQGYMDGLEAVIRLVPNDVRIIPGHGGLANLDDLKEALNMLRMTRAQVRASLARGDSLEALNERGLGEKWASWGRGFIEEGAWIKTLVRDLDHTLDR